MYYYGFFRNTDTSIDEKGQLYKVVIITNYQNDEYEVGGELILTDSPFTIEYSTDENDLFKPYKCSTATVGILQRDMNFSFNTTSGNNVLVKLLKYNNEDTEDDLSLRSSDNTHFDIEWIGFATPNAYSQSYENYFDEFELECQDALSTLQYYKYETLGNTPTFVSFADIVKKWCVFLGTYRNIYVTDTIVIPSNDFQDPLHSLYIDERNFFDEDDKPMTVLEVLEEICKYLSLTCVPQKDNLYFLSYSAIKNGQNDYYEIKKETLPYDAEVEYLESTGQYAYIDTNYIPKLNTNLTMDFQFTQPIGTRDLNGSLFGCLNTYRSRAFAFSFNGTNTLHSQWGNNAKTYVSRAYCDSLFNSWHKLVFKDGQAIIDGVSRCGTLEYAVTPTKSMYLFCLHLNATYGHGTGKRIGKVQIFEGEELVMDFIPVRVGQVGYMYDKVSGTLYKNGSGNFTLGKDIKVLNPYKLQIDKKVTLEHVHDILPNDFASNGTNLSLLTTYNKVSVKDDFYPFDSIVPNIEDDNDNIVDTNVLDTVGFSPEYTTEVVSATTDLTQINIEYGSKKHIGFLRYNGYENKPTDYMRLNTYWWDIVSGGVTPNYDIYANRDYNYQITSEHIGALPIQYQFDEVEEFTDKINSISLKDALMIACPIANVSYIGNSRNHVLEWISDNIALGEENYIVISGNFTFFIMCAYLPFKMRDYDFYMDDEYSYQWASLTCGNYWWDGEQWIENPPRQVLFKLPLKYEYGKKAYGESIPIANNIDYSMRLHKQGYAVPIPPFDGVEIKNIQFRLFNPNRIDDDGDNQYDPCIVLIENFDIEIATKNQLELLETKNDSNTEYTNEIPNGAVEEKEGTECKITTFDLKSTNHSSVLYSETFYENGYENALSNTFRRLRTIYNRGVGDIALAEEIIVNNNVAQYSTPTVQLEVNLHSDLDFKPYSLLTYHFFEGKNFVVDGMSINYRTNTNTLKLIEKK